MNETVVLGWMDDSFTQPALSLELHTIEGGFAYPPGLMDVTAKLKTDTAEVTTGLRCFGYDIAEFAQRLEMLHKRLEGSATFDNQVGEIRVEITCVDSRRGRLAVGVTFELLHFGRNAAVAGVLDKAGGNVSFDGLVLEQSYLPSIIQQLLAFLRDSGVSTSHPMSHT